MNDPNGKSNDTSSNGTANGTSSSHAAAVTTATATTSTKSKKQQNLKVYVKDSVCFVTNLPWTCTWMELKDSFVQYNPEFAMIQLEPRWSFKRMWYCIA